MNDFLKMCADHECQFNNIELHPQHGWVARVTYKGVRGTGEDQFDALYATRDAIRTAIHLHKTYNDRPTWTDLKDLDL